MARLRARDLLRMALRASLLQATWNYERQQGIGWAFSLAPALERIYPDAAERRSRLARHTAYFNTQPTMASVALGAVANLEERRSAGELVDDEAVGRAKNVLGASLAALGDRLFWFTLRPFVACLGVLMAMGGSWKGALVLWIVYNAVHQSLRALGVGWGYHAGPAAVGTPLRQRLEGLAYALSLMGTALVGILMAAFLAPDGSPGSTSFQMLMATALLGGLVVSQRARPTPTEWALLLGLVALAAAWLR